MRKTNCFKSSLMILLMFFGIVCVSGQETIFSENMGNPSNDTDVNSYTGFQNYGTLTFTGGGGVQVRKTNSESSTGYTDASGQGNVLLNATSKYIEISGINTANFTDLVLSFGVRKATNASTVPVLIQVSSDGSNYTSLTYSGLPSNSGGSSWYYITASGTIPATANLRIKFTGNNGTNTVRIDDIKLIGTSASSDPYLSAPASLSSFTYGEGNGPSTPQSFTLDGGNLEDASIEIEAPENFEISLSESTGYADQLTIDDGDIPETIYVRLKDGLTNAGSPYSGNITITGGGTAEDTTVSLTGTVTPPPPANDECGDATGITVNGGVINGTLENSTNAGSAFDNKNDVWYAFTPAYNETYTIQASNFSGDLDIELYEIACPDSDGELIQYAATSSSTETISRALSSGTTYFIRVLAWNSAAEHSFDIEVTAPAPPADCETPTEAPASLAFDTVENSSISGSFTAAGDADGYLVVMSENPTLGGIPSDETMYAANDTLGNGTVLQTGSSTTFIATGLSPLTTYYFFIFAYNDECLNGPLYNTAALSGSESTIDGPCGEEGFDNIPSNQSGYDPRTWAGFGGDWTATKARTDVALNGKAITFRSGIITSPTFNSGIGSITMTTKLPYSDTAGNLTVKINGDNVGTIAYSSTTQAFTISDINIEGNIQITIEETNNARVSVDDISWTCYTAPPSGITWIDTPEGGEWSNGTGPGINDDAVVEGELSITGNLEAKNFTIAEGGSVSIENGGSLTLSGKIINNDGNGTAFVVQSGGNLIQNTDYTANDNEGDITVLRNSQDIVRLDYTFWSSPVNAQGLKAFSQKTLWNRIYTYETNAGNLGDNGAYQAVFASESDPDTNFENGKGYLFRAPNDWDTEHDNDPAEYIGNFVGSPFNGSVNVDVYGAGGFTSVGNPYPSNIMVTGTNSLYDLNSSVIDVLFFWNNPERVWNETTETWEYTGTKYVTCTTGGCTKPGGDFVSTGQGFIVRTLPAAPENSQVSFSNAMRVNDATVFLKNEETENHRFWLALNNKDYQEYNQILVGYMEGATNNSDLQIDARLFGYDGSALYNLINEEKFVIQGRALPFESSDVVPLGFKAVEAGKFIISLTNFDGLFAEGNTIIYLKDNALNTIHNLMESDYTFESPAGEFKSRFEVVYEEEGTMGTNDLTHNNILIYKNNKNIVVESKLDHILSVELFDLQGRSIHKNTQVNSNTYSIRSQAKGVLVVRAQTQNGEIVSKKIIN